MQVNGEADRHADPCRREPVMPAEDLPQGAANKRRGDHACADAEVEDLKGVGASVIFRRVERADLDRDIALEAAGADRQAEQRPQERHVESHQKMADGHQGPAQYDRFGSAQPAIGDQSA